MKWFLLLALLAVPRLRASNLSVTGSWSVALSSASLTGGAGTNFPSSIQSPSSVFTMSVTGTPLLALYNVYAHVSTSALPPGVTLVLTRTSDGYAIPIASTISGGTGGVALSGTDTLVFSGFLDRASIGLQLTANGVSVAIPPSTYLSSVTFTVNP